MRFPRVAESRAARKNARVPGPPDDFDDFDDSDQPDRPPRERRIFVGDVQGCRDELERLLEAVRFDAERDELHPVGDFVNRGPDSLGVLRLVRELGAGGVLGNHDVHALRTAAGLRKKGRRDTLDELFAADDSDELLAWLGIGVVSQASGTLPPLRGAQAKFLWSASPNLTRGKSVVKRFCVWVFLSKL